MAQPTILTQQSHYLLDRICSAKARIAVIEKRIVNEEDFQPTRDENKDILRLAFNVILNTIPEVAQKLLESSNDNI